MKIFETNFENGTLVDKIAGLLPGTNANTKFIRERYTCVARNGASTRLSYPLFYQGQAAYSFEIWFKENNQVGNNNGYLSTAGTGFNTDKGIGIFDDGTGKIYFGVYTGSGGILNTTTNKIPKGKWTHMIITWPGLSNTKANIYINGVLNKSVNIAGSWTGLSTYPLNITTFGGVGTQITTNYVAKGIIYNHILTQKEISNNYLNFLNFYPINKSIVFQPNFNSLKPSEIKEQGLIAAYNFQPINGKLPNIAWDNTANGNNARSMDGSIHGCQNLSDSIRTKDQSNSFINLGNSPYFNFGTNDFTICMYTKSDSASSRRIIAKRNIGSVWLSLAYNTIETAAGTTYEYSSLPLLGFNTVFFIRKNNIMYIYSNGKFFTSFVFTDNINNINDPFLINGYGNTSSNQGGNFTFRDLRFYNRSLSDMEIKKYHNYFASKISIAENFSQYTVGATKINNWYFTGTVSITEETTKNNIVKIGSKLLNINSGEAYTQSNTAYGTWEWKVKYTALPGGFYNGVQFIGNSKKTEINLGYGITSTVSTGNIVDSITITKGQAFGYGGSAIKTIPVNLILNTWYKFKVTRNTNNLFKLFINDKLITTFTDSTYTTSTYFGFSKPYFNKYFTDIKITQGIIA